jgi:hypothetical protein
MLPWYSEGFVGEEIAPNAECMTRAGDFLATCGRDIDANNARSIDPLIASYTSMFDSKKAEADALVIEYRNLEGAAPKLGSVLETNLSDLEHQKNSLEKEIRQLENEANVNNSEFHEQNAAVAGKTSTYTLQDWLGVLLMIAFVFAAISGVIYVSYTSGWEKKYMIGSSIGAGVIGILLYSIYVNFA